VARPEAEEATTATSSARPRPAVGLLVVVVYGLLVLGFVSFIFKVC